MINTEDISIVFAGRFNDDELKQSLPLAHKVFPGAEFILSARNPVTGYKDMFHKIVDVPDAGGEVVMEKGFDTLPTNGYGYEWKNIVSNKHLNRQIISSRLGVEQASRSYVLKIRADLYLTSADWLMFFDEAVELAKPTRLKNPILIGNYRDPTKWTIFPYHFHDWLAFGLKEDLQTLYSCPIIEEKVVLTEDHFKTHIDLRCTPETYVGGKLFYPNENLVFLDKPNEVLKDMVNHYVPIDLGAHYAWSPKFSHDSLLENCLVSHASWLKYVREVNK